MAIYCVMYSQITYYAVNIEADNEPEALELFNNIDNCMMTELPEIDYQVENINIANENNLLHYITVKKELNENI